MPILGKRIKCKLFIGEHIYEPFVPVMGPNNAVAVDANDSGIRGGYVGETCIREESVYLD